MQQELILYPALASMGLTFAVGFTMLRLRFLAVGRGEVNPRYFLLNRGGKVPEYVARVEQNYSNQLELPMLFYALALMLYVTGSVNTPQLTLAWAFIATRVAHAAIHITVNRLRWRMIAFVSGAVILLSSWVGVLVQLATASPP